MISNRHRIYWEVIIELDLVIQVNRIWTTTLDHWTDRLIKRVVMMKFIMSSIIMVDWEGVKGLITESVDILN